MNNGNLAEHSRQRAKCETLPAPAGGINTPITVKGRIGMNVLYVAYFLTVNTTRIKKSAGNDGIEKIRNKTNLSRMV